MTGTDIFDLAGKAAVITGGLRALALQIAGVPRAHGAGVLWSVRKADELQRTQSNLQTIGVAHHRPDGR